MMPTLHWRAVRLAEKLSLISKLALCLLLLTGLAYLLLYRPQLQSLQLLKAQPISQSQSTSDAQPKSTTANQQQNQLIAYLAQFPATGARAASMGTLMDIAKQQDILLDEVTYKSDTNTDLGVNRYHVNFSLFATYAEVHHFLQSVLSQMPFVALETLHLNRETTDDNMLEARIQLCFYFGIHT